MMADINLLQAGTYTFTKGDVCRIYRFYKDDGLALWQIKNQHFQMADIKQIAVAVSHGKINIQSISHCYVVYIPWIIVKN